MFVPPTPVLEEETTKWEPKDPSLASEEESTINVAMGQGAILFVNAGAGPPNGTSGTVYTEVAGKLRGDEQVLKDLVKGDAERPVMQGKRRCCFLRLRLDRLSPSYWPPTGTSVSGLVGLTVTPISCPYPSEEQRLCFSYRYYIYQIESNAQMTRYL